MAIINKPNLGGFVGSSSSSGRFGDFVVALVGFAVGLALAVILMALLTYFASYLLVDLVAVKLGLINAWARLVSVNGTVQTFTALAGDSLLAGALTGSLVGIAHLFRRWRKDHHQWVVEALFSSEALAAFRFGFACLALHVTISVFASWLVSLGGAYWPWPAALGGHGGTLVVAGILATGGGFGGPSGWEPATFAFAIVFAILLVSFFAAIAISLSYSGVALILGVIGEGMLRGGLSGGSLAAAGKLMGSVLSSESPYPDWWVEVVSTGIRTGAINAVLYLLIVFVGGAVFGIDYISAN
jgi:hypothetical protein